MDKKQFLDKYFSELKSLINFNQKEKIICNEDDINFFEVYKNIKENLLNYKDNVWPLYLADPVAEKKDPLWFAKKKS